MVKIHIADLSYIGHGANVVLERPLCGCKPPLHGDYMTPGSYRELVYYIGGHKDHAFCLNCLRKYRKLADKEGK